MAEEKAVKCPECGVEVFVPVKTWTLVPKRRNGASLRIRFYVCHRCYHRWRVTEKLGEEVRREMPGF